VTGRSCSASRSSGGNIDSGTTSGILRRVNVLRADFNLENFPYPWQKAGQFASAQFVSNSSNDDVPIFAEVEMCIAKSPDVEALASVSAAGVVVPGQRRIHRKQGREDVLFRICCSNSIGFYRETGLTPS
jgi:hypothetical protein